VSGYQSLAGKARIDMPSIPLFGKRIQARHQVGCDFDFRLGDVRSFFAATSKAEAWEPK
jgi:hypothetical protein